MAHHHILCFSDRPGQLSTAANTVPTILNCSRRPITSRGSIHHSEVAHPPQAPALSSSEFICRDQHEQPSGSPQLPSRFSTTSGTTASRAIMKAASSGATSVSISPPHPKPEPRNRARPPAGPGWVSTTALPCPGCPVIAPSSTPLLLGGAPGGRQLFPDRPARPNRDRTVADSYPTRSEVNTACLPPGAEPPRGHCQSAVNLGGDGCGRRVSGPCQCPVMIHSVVLSGCGGQADDLVPGAKVGGHLTAVLLGAKTVAAGSEVRGNTAEGGEEPLGVPGEVNVFIARSRAQVGWCPSPWMAGAHRRPSDRVGSGQGARHSSGQARPPNRQQ